MANLLEPSSESGDDEGRNDVILADKPPYVIGGLTIACIIIVIVVFIFLWKKYRPCKYSQWRVEGSPTKCRAVRLKNIQVVCPLCHHDGGDDDEDDDGDGGGGDDDDDDGDGGGGDDDDDDGDGDDNDDDDDGDDDETAELSA
ncbi:hypothetical protein ACOMHN_038478 [Nucella lapillus]